MQLNFEGQVLAANVETRTIRGLVVPFNVSGNTSAGPVRFQFGAFGDIDPSQIVLNSEHDRTRPLGRGIGGSVEVSPAGISMAFKIAPTNAGNDALVEAAEGLRPAFSIEAKVNEYTIEKGVMIVASAVMEAVAHVTSPAFSDAQILEVAASESEETPETPEAETAAEDKPQEIIVETENTAPVPDEVTASAVIQAAAPVAYTKPRTPIVDKKSYLEHFLKANVLNDEDSKLYIRAADNTTSTAPGMIPTPQSTTVINALANNDRGMIDALSRETLVTEGMTFELPRVTAVPTVSNIAENVAVTESSLSATFLSVPVESFKGRAITTVELIDRSRPEYIAALLQNLEFAYAKVTDEFAVGTIQAAGQQTGVNANTKDGFLGYTTQASSAAYVASLGFAKNIVVSPGQWANIMGYNDGGRPIYNASQPMNAGGDVNAGSLRGSVSPGLDLFVSRSIGNAAATTDTGDFSMVVVNPDAWTWYESPRFTLRTAIQSDGTVDLLYYGYAAIAPKIPLGAVWNQT
jgi:phage head maturation protease